VQTCALPILLLGNLLDVVVLEQGEIQRRQTRPVDDVASGITAQIKTWQSREPTCTVQCRILRIVNRDLVSILVHQTWRVWVAVRAPERQIRRGGDLEAGPLYVVVDISRVRKRLAAGAAQSVQISPIVTAVGICQA